MAASASPAAPGQARREARHCLARRPEISQSAVKLDFPLAAGRPQPQRVGRAIVADGKFARHLQGRSAGANRDAIRRAIPRATRAKSLARRRDRRRRLHPRNTAGRSPAATGCGVTCKPNFAPKRPSRDEAESVPQSRKFSEMIRVPLRFGSASPCRHFRQNSGIWRALRADGVTRPASEYFSPLCKMPCDASVCPCAEGPMSAKQGRVTRAPQFVERPQPGDAAAEDQRGDVEIGHGN